MGTSSDMARRPPSPSPPPPPPWTKGIHPSFWAELYAPNGCQSGTDLGHMHRVSSSVRRAQHGRVLRDSMSGGAGKFRTAILYVVDGLEASANGLILLEAPQSAICLGKVVLFFLITRLEVWRCLRVNRVALAATFAIVHCQLPAQWMGRLAGSPWIFLGERILGENDTFPSICRMVSRGICYRGGPLR